ncbi:hypothetical protein [Mycobacteroides chelonae]|uniref:hypothetical protein n=1 Tax=Mycobacteroides chelonae TaxID=1774 RepID=UPI00099480FC|nr:hypothetical protein [Mycobacteroides chelonae]
MSKTIEAIELSGTNIDEVISFDWEFSSGVEARVRGELRQVYHVGGSVTVHLCDPTASTGSLTEFELNEDDEVSFG